MTLAPPPADLPPKPLVHRLEKNSLLVRIYDPRRGSWERRRRFGPLPEARWDHHEPPLRMHRTRSVWYASLSLQGAIAEVCGRFGFVDRGSRLRIALARSKAPIDVLDLVGVGARRVGLTQEVAATRDHAACQAWARAIYEQYVDLHGIRWRGRQSGSICVVLTDRTPRTILRVVSDHAMADPVVWPRVARAARRCSLAIV